MAPHKFELSDISDSQTNLTTGGGRRRGCYVSTAVGFILILLAAVVAVGVGIIVHFAGGNRDVVCNCQSATPSDEIIKQECIKLAALGDSAVCDKCSASIPSTTVKPGITVVSTTSVPGTTVAPTEPPNVKDVRLPTSVVPIHYDVELQPNMYGGDPQLFTFKGSVSVLISCTEPTDNITLHVNVLTVDESSIKFTAQTPGSSDPVFTHTAIDKLRQFFIVKLDRSMERNKTYILSMNFTSPLKNDLHGLYYSVYTRNGSNVYLATTQFQPTDARKAFPCFDEPAIKATFNITLVRPYHLKSLSNMPIIANSTTFNEGGIIYVKDVYQTTPKMSTYLLAFIVCDFEYTSKITAHNVMYRAWATPESVDQTPYSLDVGVKIIEYFEDYFNVTYPLPKQDMIAIPDFAAGAMENWGLITYRETAMLYKEGVSNEANKERVAIVVSHELAHQWFGNLVTPSWWDDLWLNEGFASFVEYLGVDKVHPDWNMFDIFVISDIQNAFDFDGLTTSHPVYVPVAHPDEINEIFDTISYSKGASIIRMMRHFLGEETFKKGLTNYLKKLAYGAAFHDDLWNELTEQAKRDNKSHINVKDIMDTWALQMNFPVVTVTRDFNKHNQVEVEQERYLSDPTAKDPLKYISPFGYRWNIPLTLTSSNNPNFNQNDGHVFWLFKNETQKTLTIDSPGNDNDSWILANVQQYGYYRVNYHPGNWESLGRQLERNHSVIPVINRAQIINDAWNLARAGTIKLETALVTIKYLKKEKDYVPWYAARAELNFVESMLSFTSLYGSFQNFMKDTLNDTYYELGLDSITSDHTGVAAQVLIAGQSCYYGIEPCLQEVSRQYHAWMKTNNNTINPNIKSVVYCYAIANGGWAEWKWALERYNDADTASEKSRLLSALSCSKQPWILNHFLNLILEKNSPIRKQDALSVVSSVSRNNIGRYLAWNFFRGRYAKLKDEFGSSFFAWGSVIRAVAESFNTEFERNEVSVFKESQSGNLGSGERAFEQALEKVASNIKWMDTNFGNIHKFLKDGHFLTD